MMAEMGTPRGSLALGERTGLFAIGAVKRLLGWAALPPEALSHGRPRQSISPAGGASSIPSHQTSPSGVIATLVKMVSCASRRIALGLDLTLVPGATPK